MMNGYIEANRHFREDILLNWLKERGLQLNPEEIRKPLATYWKLKPLYNNNGYNWWEISEVEISRMELDLCKRKEVKEKMEQREKNGPVWIQPHNASTRKDDEKEFGIPKHGPINPH